MPLQGRTAATFAAPIVQAQAWLEGVTFPPERPLINLSQAAPVAAPPAPLRDHIASLIRDVPEVHLYGAVLGLSELREELAANIASLYGGTVAHDQVAITPGCNQAFAAAIAAIAAEGDEVILPTPWYFNHKMWLDMMGVNAVPQPTGPDLLPDPNAAAALITPRTRAIALVSPNNPAGVEYPADLLDAFFDLAQTRGLRLILDETYRDFRADAGAPHALFARPDWDTTLVHLYSFSKSFRLTGHRVGALASAPALLAQAERYLDTTTICPSQIGQHAALFGLRHLQDWLAGERQEILNRRAALARGVARLAPLGWKLRGLGAYFAYVEHPFDLHADDLAPRMVRDAHLLMLPGSMFLPEGDARGARVLRLAFANADSDGLGVVIDRLEQLAI